MPTIENTKINETSMLKPVFTFDYDEVIELIRSKQITNGNSFVRDWTKNLIYTVNDKQKSDNDWYITLTNWDISTESLLTWFRLYEVPNSNIVYVLQYYRNDNRIVIYYKDIILSTNYYGEISDWIKNSLWFINDYFQNNVDSLITQAIENINIDSTSILAIIDKYNLPNSRDFMLVNAINKYSSEMEKLLNSIDNLRVKDSLKWAISSLKKCFVPTKKEEKEEEQDWLILL